MIYYRTRINQLFIVIFTFVGELIFSVARAHYYQHNTGCHYQKANIEHKKY